MNAVIEHLSEQAQKEALERHELQRERSMSQFSQSRSKPPGKDVSTKWGDD